ncbi:MAG: hypothetical protein CSB55_03510 [Candidatus Cloacimonadota bacterium]|nr:MAG: hypothetical protein CSB55_03510 [Candidatus Cloacimonadota bacterium]
MNKIDRKKYTERYNKRFNIYGFDLKTLGWGGDENRQKLRFKIALELENFLQRGKIKSVLDVGCGFGDMGKYILEKCENISYTGVDINPLLIDEGKKKYPELNLKCLDILDDYFEEKFDLVLENGIFNFKLQGENQLEYIEAMIKKMYSLSCFGVSVDFMSTFTDFQHEGAFHMNEQEALKIAKSLSRRVVLRNDYLDYEYSLYILKTS